MRRILLAALLASIAGPALAAERAFPTGGAFDRVASSTPFDVYVHTGRAGAVRAVGTDEAIAQLQIENRNGELRIGTKPGRWLSSWYGRRGQRARIDVMVPAISAASLSGPGNLTIDRVQSKTFRGSLMGPGNLTIGAVDVDAIDLNLSGPGDIAVAGRAAHATLRLSGPGDIHAEKLMAADAIVTLSGPGDVDANVSRTAQVRLSGPGDVRIRGGGRCSIRKSGPGDVTCN